MSFFNFLQSYIRVFTKKNWVGAPGEERHKCTINKKCCEFTIKASASFFFFFYNS